MIAHLGVYLPVLLLQLANLAAYPTLVFVRPPPSVRISGC